MMKYLFKSKGFSITRCFSTINGGSNPLKDIIKAEILNNGPMTFPTFWSKALTHEKHGYYMKKDVFNRRGDFVTSVEMSQIFCEVVFRLNIKLIGIWVVYVLQAMNIVDKESNKQNGKFHLIEFGPGLGTLQSEILGVLDQFNLINDMQITFIERSDYMTKRQQETVTKRLQKMGIFTKYEYTDKRVCEKFTSDRIQLRWFKSYEQMVGEDYGEHILKPDTKSKLKPFTESPIIAIAHEFFDALPVHLFQYDMNVGWCERLVSVGHNGELTYQNTAGPNENVLKILKPNQRFSKEVQASIRDGDTIEVNAQGALLVNSLAELISKVQGCALVVDYGEFHSFSNSVRAIADHKILPNEDILAKPGLCDISAYVDFSHLSAAVSKVQGVKVSSIMNQGLWLESMGINQRAEILLRQANMHQQKLLSSQIDRLVNKDQMGEIFKFWSFCHQAHGELFPFIQSDEQIYY